MGTKRYITPTGSGQEVLSLNTERWVLESLSHSYRHNARDNLDVNGLLALSHCWLMQ